MIYLSATEAKQNFAEFLDKAQKEPITCSLLPLFAPLRLCVSLIPPHQTTQEKYHQPAHYN